MCVHISIRNGEYGKKSYDFTIHNKYHNLRFAKRLAEKTADLYFVYKIFQNYLAREMKESETFS